MNNDAEFRLWLSAKSWNVGVRYCRALLWLLPLGAALLDMPLLLAEGQEAARKLEALVAWQTAAWVASAAVVLTDMALSSPGKRELVLYSYCALFMAILTWLGVIALWHGGNGMVIYAAGATFIAAVISTPRPIRRPLYVLSVMGLMLAVLPRTQDPAALIAALGNPLCVVILCLALDRFTYSRDVELYAEVRRAEAERARADKVLYNVLPVSIADELKREDRVNAVKFENLGVLFGDIAGFTAYSRSMPPDALVLMLNQLFSTFDECVDRLGLEKIKTIGDAYMVVSYGQAAPLCELALQMQAAMAAYNRANGTSLFMRIGIHVGPAVAGVIGVKRFLYDVWGDTVNVASRMEASGEEGATHVTEAVVLQASGSFCFEPRGVVRIKGRGPMKTYWLTSRVSGEGAIAPQREALSVAPVPTS